MDRHASRRAGFSGVILAAALFFNGCTSCFSPNVKGHYADASGIFKLDLKSGGQATLTTMNDSTACTYKVDGKQVAVTCENQMLNFTVQDDGSLAPPATSPLGPLHKVKS